LRLGEPVATAAGDRFVLRRSSPAGTLAGGVVLDDAPPVGPSRRRITADLLRTLGEQASSRAAAAGTLVELHGAYPAGPRVAGADGQALAGWVIAPDVAAALRDAALTAVADAGSAGIPLAELRPMLARRLRRLVTLPPKSVAAVAAALVDGLADGGAVVRDGDLVRAPGPAPRGPGPEVIAAMDRLEAALDVAAPPALVRAALATGCPPEGIRALEAAARIVRIDADLAYAAPAFARLEDVALRLAAAGPLLPATLRDATGTSRKYVMAVIEELDRRGVLRRTPDGHVVGPRANR
jgi:selenocysteine-specific elongation factor